MGLSVTIKDIDGNELYGFKPANRMQDLKGVFEGDKAVNGCTCSGGMFCQCYEYDDYLITEVGEITEPTVIEYLEKYKKLLLSYSC